MRCRHAICTLLAGAALAAAAPAWAVAVREADGAIQVYAP